MITKSENVCRTISLISLFKEFLQLYLHDFRNLLPLLRPRVHTGGVVGTSMQQNDTLLWDGLPQKRKKGKKENNLHHALKFIQINLFNAVQSIKKIGLQLN